MTALKFLQPVLYSDLVGGPISSHEDKTIEHAAWSDHRHVFYRLFEEDEDMAVHVVGVGYPPKVKPIGVYLMISHQDHSRWKVRFQSSIQGLLQLSANALVPTYAHYGWSEPLSDGIDNDAERLFRQGHPRIVIIPINEV